MTRLENVPDPILRKVKDVLLIATSVIGLIAGAAGLLAAFTEIYQKPIAIDARLKTHCAKYEPIVDELKGQMVLANARHDAVIERLIDIKRDLEILQGKRRAN